MQTASEQYLLVRIKGLYRGLVGSNHPELLLPCFLKLPTLHELRVTNLIAPSPDEKSKRAEEVK